MKKFIRGAAVLGMILCLAVTALAAPGDKDPSTTSLCEIDMDNVKGPNGEHVDLIIGDVKEEIIPVEIGDPVDFSSKDEDTDVTVVYLKDITSDVLPVTITFEVPAAGANDVLHVMHYNGEDWDEITRGTGSSITATFTSLSPVAVVLERPAETKPTPGGPTSPVTGEAPILLVAAVVALLAGTVAVVTVKKKEM